MKTLNKMTVEKLEELSEDRLTNNYVLGCLFPEHNNTYNYSNVNPNGFDYYYNPDDLGEPGKYGAIAFHLGGDIRGNYSDYYLIPMDEFDILIQDIAEYEIETQAEANEINQFLSTNNIDQSVEIGSTITVDYESDYISIDGNEGFEGLVSKWFDLEVS